MDHAGRADVIVLGLPRGGVVVAAEVAAALDAPLDAFLVRKLGVPGYPEFAMGAVAEGGVRVLGEQTIRALGVSKAAIDDVTARERRELERRATAFRGARPPAAIRDRTVILIDDGLATGATMEAAVMALRDQHPARIVIGVPVGARETCERLARLVVDTLVCLDMPEPFEAVGLWYRDFSQTTDEEVRLLLAATHRPATS